MVYNMRVYNINNEQKKNAFMKKNDGTRRWVDWGRWTVLIIRKYFF